VKHLKLSFGIFLIFFSLFVIVAIGLPILYDSKEAGRVSKVIKNIELNNSDNRVVLLYFGYVGCDTICIPSLSDMSKILNKSKYKPKIYFANLYSNVSDESVKGFVNFVDRDIDYKNGEEALKLARELGVTFVPLSESIEHLGHLYLLVKSDKGYETKYIYTTRPFNIELVLKDIEKEFR
jgi:protein SCO1/2